MTESLLTPAQVGERLNLTAHQVLTLRLRNNWPCVEFNRKSVRFTEEQVAEIIERHTAEREPEVDLPVIAGQTKGSRRRRSA